MAYWISALYRPAAARGVRYDDPQLAIAWPLRPTVISARDRDLPVLDGMTRVLVTGGSGFVGRQVVPHLAPPGST